MLVYTEKYYMYSAEACSESGKLINMSVLLRAAGQQAID